jgi:hypothetical protein
MDYFSIGVELDAPAATSDQVDSWMDYLLAANLHPSISTSPRGFLQFKVSAQGTALLPAIITAVSTLERLVGRPALVVEALTEAEEEARDGYAELPEMVSITQAAELLGRTRQRVHQMIETRQLPSAQQVGNAWIIAKSDVLAKVEPTELKEES